MAFPVTGAYDHAPPGTEVGLGQGPHARSRRPPRGGREEPGVMAATGDAAAPLGRFCTIREAADYLGVGETFVKERIRRGELEAVHLGAGTRVIVASLVEYADAREREGRRRP